MKILTITLHSAHNPGSMLQAYALQTFLIDNSYDTQIIDYRPDYVATEGNKLADFIKKILNFKDHRQRAYKFEAFIKENLRLTPNRYNSYEELVSKPPIADCYITGSDQLWNSSYNCGRDKAFYLRFVNKAYKLSYAVSIGKKNIPSNELDWIYENTKDFDWISVREGTSRKQLEERGYTNLAYVCDPVLLLSKEKYIKLKKENSHERYIAVYLVKKSELLDKLIEELKKKFSYKVILIGGFTKRCECDIHIKDMGPCDFLGLLEGAEFIVASSFHATVFSHIFQKNFAVILPEGNSARIEEFLEISNTKDKIVRKEEDISIAIESINYEISVNPHLDKFVNESKKIFLQILKGAKDK